MARPPPLRGLSSPLVRENLRWLCRRNQRNRYAILDGLSYAKMGFRVGLAFICFDVSWWFMVLGLAPMFGCAEKLRTNVGFWIVLCLNLFRLAVSRRVCIGITWLDLRGLISRRFWRWVSGKQQRCLGILFSAVSFFLETDRFAKKKKSKI